MNVYRVTIEVDVPAHLVNADDPRAEGEATVHAAVLVQDALDAYGLGESTAVKVEEVQA